MIRICAWCEAVLDLGPPLDDPAVTYGVCPECWSRRRKPKSTVSADTEFLAASQAMAPANGPAQATAVRRLRALARGTAVTAGIRRAGADRP